MDEHLIINLRVADRRYPLRVKRDEEEEYRKAAREIDYKLEQYKESFTGDSAQLLNNSDYMAMTAIQAVAGTVKQEMRLTAFELAIQNLVSEMDSYLKMQLNN